MNLGHCNKSTKLSTGWKQLQKSGGSGLSSGRLADTESQHPIPKKGKCLGNPQTEEGDHIHATEVHSKVSYSDVTPMTGSFGHFATHQTNLDKAELYLPSLRRCTKTAYHEAWKNKRYEAREAWSAWGMKARWVWSMNAEKKSIVWVGSCDVPKRQHLPAYPEASLLVVRVSIIRDTPWGSLG